DRLGFVSGLEVNLHQELQRLADDLLWLDPSVPPDGDSVFDHGDGAIEIVLAQLGRKRNRRVRRRKPSRGILHALPQPAKSVHGFARLRHGRLSLGRGDAGGHRHGHHDNSLCWFATGHGRGSFGALTAPRLGSALAGPLLSPALCFERWTGSNTIR